MQQPQVRPGTGSRTDIGTGQAKGRKLIRRDEVSGTVATPTLKMSRQSYDGKYYLMSPVSNDNYQSDCCIERGVNENLYLGKVYVA